MMMGLRNQIKNKSCDRDHLKNLMKIENIRQCWFKSLGVGAVSDHFSDNFLKLLGLQSWASKRILYKQLQIALLT